MSKKEIKSSKKEKKKQIKKDQKKAKRAAMSVGEKIRQFFLRLFLSVLVLAILVAGVIGLLVYYDIVDIPFVKDLFVSIGIEEGKESESTPSEVGESTSSKENSSVSDQNMSFDEDMPQSYEVAPPDADEYFHNNSQVISEMCVKDSNTVHTEAEAYANFADRGFTDYSITTEYSMDGEYSDAVDISDTSSATHPIYQTYYITESGDIWTIFEINGVVMANPVSYNMESDFGIQVIISESNTVTSYDSTTNKFYETIPKVTELLVQTVSRIDAETLESLTVGEIYDYD